MSKDSSPLSPSPSRRQRHKHIPHGPASEIRRCHISSCRTNKLFT